MFSLQLITPLDCVIAALGAETALGVCVVTGRPVPSLFQPHRVISTQPICAFVCVLVWVEGSFWVCTLSVPSILTHKDGE
jgi:hypothetical protein